MGDGAWGVRRVVTAAVVLLAAGVVAGCTEERSLQAGDCIDSTDKGVEVVDCDSPQAESRLVESAGTIYDLTEPDCPDGTDVIGIRPREGVGIRWCVSAP